MKTYEEELIRFLDAHPDQIYKARELAKHLHVSNRDYQDFKRIVHGMAEQGTIARFKGNRVGRIRRPQSITGILHVKTQGYGFVIRDDGGEDVFVSQKNMASALHRDRVRVLLWAKSIGKLPEGKVIEVLGRGRERVVGTFQEGRTFNYVVPDELKMTRDVYVSRENGARAQAGQKVVVDIVRWGSARRMPEGRIAEVLGFPGDAGVDILSIIHQFNLPLDFPPQVMKQTEAIPAGITDSMLEGRLDLRNIVTLTIDPEDARDFDDAVSLEELPNRNVKLGVHIADVSAYVTPGSAVDKEALRRGTSIYLVDRVIPMLPERLSGDLCSLRPGEDRLTYSVLMELTPQGNLVDYDIRESIIRSRCRLTYKQAHRMITGNRDSGIGARGKKSPLKLEGLSEKELRDTLLRMHRLSRILMKRWRASGSIDFDVPEAEVVLDDKGFPVELKIRERLDSHILIESFMLLANRTVAESISRIRQERDQKVPFVYRIHEKPNEKKLDTFTRFVRAMGYDFQLRKKITPRMFQDFLDHVKGTPHEIIIEDIVLRTMMKAIYSTRDAGHFGLAFKHYTHFTSPIRRYPDLTVHRLLKAYTRRAGPPKLAAKLSEICDIATEREIVAQEAEWESVKSKQVMFMEQHLGDEFEGVVSGVVSFGLFVEIPETLVEGLVHIKDLDDDYYVYDESHFCLIGQNKGRTYRLGDPVRVQVVRVLKELRKIDFILV